MTGGYLGKDRRHTLSSSTAQINCVGQGVAGLGNRNRTRHNAAPIQRHSTVKLPVVEPAAAALPNYL